jgi:hypothetical protein
MAEKFEEELPKDGHSESGETAFAGSHPPTPPGGEESIPIGDEVHEGSDGSASSSTISIGTGHSAADVNDWSPEDPGETDVWDASQNPSFDPDGDEPLSAGSFGLPDDFNATMDADFAFGEASEPEAHDKSSDADVVSEFSEFAEIENPEMAADLIGETSQDDLPAVWTDVEGSAERMANGLFGDDLLPERISHAHGNVIRDGLPRRPQRRTRARGSIIGVIFGGLLAVPVVAAILLWGFRRDDFGIAAQVPDSLSFLIPEDLRRATVKKPDAEDVPPLPRLPAAGFEPGRQQDTWDRSPLPDTEQAGIIGRDAQADAVLNAADLAVLEMATVRAEIMLESVRELRADSPETMRKAVLIDWYKSLASVGAEAAAAEGLMVTGGRSTAGIAEPLEKLLQPVMDDPETFDQLEELARQWMRASKRDSEGVILPGTLEEVRQAGSAWVSSLRSGNSEDRLLRITALSRFRPEAEEGERVIAVGMVVADNVMWAATWVSRDPSGAPGVAETPGAPEQ